MGLFGQRKGTQILDETQAPEYEYSQRKKKNGKREINPLHASLETRDTYENNDMFNSKMDMIKVDKNCLRCSGNPSLVMQHLKIACLSYTQAPICYANKDYLVSELLRVKARVIS